MSGIVLHSRGVIKINKIFSLPSRSLRSEVEYLPADRYETSHHRGECPKRKFFRESTCLGRLGTVAQVTDPAAEYLPLVL